ncbi:hypothetical protein Pfo_028530 [Paulownia fortunei]|nr:hypothetical protein Pfo_028530 [Paulownia fortunei]
MESSSSKVEAMKPFLLKAGIPLAVTLAGFILARIATRKSSLPTASPPPSESQVNSQETDSCETYADEESFHSLDSECLPCVHEDDHSCADAHYHSNALESSVMKEIYELQEEILGLRSRIEDMQDREWQLEKRFLYYQDLKDQEIVLMELQNKLMLEINRVEFLGREISLLEAEIERYENIAVEYLKVLRLLEFSRSENEQLHKRVKKLLRKTKEHCRILRKQSLQIESKETEISKNKKELEVKADCIRLMEDEIRELKLITELLQGEKNELSYKLRVAEESAASKVEGETVTIENYNQLACELERLQKDEAAEVKELIYLRWSNACLRHELMRRNQEQEQMQENKQMENNFGGMVEIEEFGSDNELNRCTLGQGESNLGFTSQNHAHSKRRKLIAKFKRWVEGIEKSKQNLDEKEKHGNKCFRRCSVSDEAEEAYLPARKSCSSA